MKEKIFNLYLFTENQLISKLGARSFYLEGTDEEKLTFLKNKADKDLDQIERFQVPENYQLFLKGKKLTGIIRPEIYSQLSMFGKALDVFIQVLEHYNAPERPLCCISHIVNGEFKKQGESELLHNQEEFSLIQFNESESFLNKYTRDGVFHVLELIDDDFYAPIDILLENNFLIPATKLLFSSIDSFAFLRFGDQKNIFKEWVENYVNISDLIITTDELWELRNSLLHMSNYDSRKNIKGVIPRLMIYEGIDVSKFSNSNNRQKMLNFQIFYDRIKEAVINWLKETMKNNNKESFIERYKLIASDFRTEEMIVWK